jgi:hypothetical protein
MWTTLAAGLGATYSLRVDSHQLDAALHNWWRKRWQSAARYPWRPLPAYLDDREATIEQHHATVNGIKAFYREWYWIHPEPGSYEWLLAHPEALSRVAPSVRERFLRYKAARSAAETGE